MSLPLSYFSCHKTFEQLKIKNSYSFDAQIITFSLDSLKLHLYLNLFSFCLPIVDHYELSFFNSLLMSVMFSSKYAFYHL